MTVLCGDFNIVAKVGAAARITPLDVETQFQNQGKAEWKTGPSKFK